MQDVRRLLEIVVKDDVFLLGEGRACTEQECTKCKNVGEFVLHFRSDIRF